MFVSEAVPHLSQSSVLDQPSAAVAPQPAQTRPRACWLLAASFSRAHLLFFSLCSPSTRILFITATLLLNKGDPCQKGSLRDRNQVLTREKAVSDRQKVAKSRAIEQLCQQVIRDRGQNQNQNDANMRQ